MDINEYKKIAIPKIEAGKMVEIVRKTIKDLEDMKQDRYEEQKEVYKPIVEKLEKEINEISDLREEYVKSANKPITYIQQQKQQALPNVEPKVVDLDIGFTPDDKKILSEYNLPTPSELFSVSINDDDIVKKTYEQSSQINKKLGGLKGSLSKSKKSRRQNADRINEYNNVIDTISKYKTRIAIIEEGKTTMQQSGKGVYNQTKRNAYKINQTTGEYGNLKIDLPKLFGQLKMIASKNGKKIYDKNIDFDTLDLFMKRYNGKKKYSDLSRMVFNDINKLAQIPIHRSSKKYKKIGAGVVYYNNPQDLLSRLELLGGSISAGNNAVKNEFSEVAHVLRKLKILSNEQLKKLLNDYVV